MPKLAVGCIVRNESRDLPRMLRSIAGIADAIYVIDTGSTDDTVEIAKSFGAHVRTYTEASRLIDGEWKLFDFSKARNEFIADIEASGATHLMWMDGDDELLTPAQVRRALYWDEYDVFGMQIEQNGQRWVHYRLWKTGRGIRFEGRCHEWPIIDGQKVMVLEDCVVRHDPEPGDGENSNVRNLRILTAEFAERPTPRTAFYLGATHRDGGRWKEAAEMFGKRIEMGEGYRDEWLFAWLYKARCERAAGDIEAALNTLVGGIEQQPDWAEYWMELAYMAYEHQRYIEAIGHALKAFDAPIPPTQLWRENNKYTDQPPRIISWCYQLLGDKAKALEWAKKAAERIGGPDEQWTARIKRLEGGQKVISLHRPGAIGDILMTLNCIPALRAANPGAEIRYYCHPSIATPLMETMFAAGVDVVETAANYRGDGINLVGYPLAEGYPEKPMRQHLLCYFAAEMGLTILGQDELPALTLPLPRLANGPKTAYATLQPKAGWSAYKNWPIERWEAVIASLDFPVIQVGQADEPKVVGAIHDYMGTPLSTAIALVANATLHMGVDSFANHLTHYRWQREDGSVKRTLGVIVWGSTQPSAAGYPHNVNISLNMPCSPCFREDPKISRMSRGPCINPPGQVYDVPKHACLHDLPIERVLEAVRRMWEQQQ